MLPYLTEHFGNPSGVHAMARRARVAVEDARDSVSAHLGVDPGQVVFTAGGTEACNLGVLGPWRARGGAVVCSAVVCSAVEHPAVLEAARATGVATFVPVDRAGTIDLDALGERLASGHPEVRPEVGVVSVMSANNETGVIQPLDQVATLVRELAPGAVLHTDAVGAGACLDLAEICRQADLVSLGAHKFGGPKGVGALVVGADVELAPILHGGPQERERRPGTHDVAGIVGMAAALEAALASGPAEVDRVRRLRDRLAEGLSEVPGVVASVPGVSSRDVLPGTWHVRVDGVDNQELLFMLDAEGICASAGSACASGALEPSHVLQAMGWSEVQARSAVRFSLGWTTTSADVDEAVRVGAKAIARLRA